MSKVRDQGRIIIKTPTQCKNICKFFFTKRDASLYITFNYLGEQYYYGRSIFKPGEKNVNIKYLESKCVIETPKFSYHESGRVHLKTTRGEETLEDVSSTPLVDLDNNHILTLVAESLDRFEDFTGFRDYPNVEIRFDHEFDGMKLVVYASTSDISSKYPIHFYLSRNLQDMYFGINYATFPTISEGKPGLTVITGWGKHAIALSEPAEFIYLKAV